MSMLADKIRIVVVDDNTDTLNNLKKLLYFEKDIEIVATAASGEDGVQASVLHQPDVVLMDINMPGMDGISASEIINTRVPSAQIIIMSVQAEADYLRRAMMAGARDFLIKPFSSEQLASTVRKVYALGAGQRSGALVTALAAPAQREPVERAAPMVGMPQSVAAQPSVLTQYAQTSTLTPPKPQYASSAPTFVVAPAAPTNPIPVDGVKQGTVFAVVSANGGVGRSTIAANLAIALKGETNGKVGLVDCSLRFGDIGVLLNLTSTHTISDIAAAEGGVDTEILVDVMSTHPSGIKVLLAPASPELADLVGPQAMRTILNTLREHFDFLILDTFTSFDEVMLTILDVADQIVLLTTSELPSIKNTKLFFEVIDALKYPTEKTLLVLNKYDPKSTIKPDDIQASIKHAVYSMIERDDRATTQAAQTGQPFVVNQRNSSATVGVQRLAKLLTRPPEPVAVPASADAKPQRRGLFR